MKYNQALSKKRGDLFIISAPSGAGKTSLAKALTEKYTHLKLSISYTTRLRRTGELHGVNYFFVSEQAFKESIKANAFMEYARVFNFYYGTSFDWVDKTLSQGLHVLLEIDWQGALQVQKKMPEAISIFILPPSLQALEDRLYKRSQDHDHVIKQRLAGAQEEIQYYDAFDYIVINENFDKALEDLSVIIKSQSLQCQSQIKRHQVLLDNLLKKN